jgi:uncharacterized protein YbjQ (UPF0145 family)
MKTEKMKELMLGMMDSFETKMEADKERMVARMEAEIENIKANQVDMITSQNLGKKKATDLEANP